MNPWNILFPFQKYMKNFTGTPQLRDMEEYMSKMVADLQNGNLGKMSNTEATSSNTSSSQQEHMQQSKISAAIFETHNDVFIRLPIEENVQLKNMKIYHTSNTLILEGIPELSDRNTFTLPAIVKKKGSTAQYKDGTLEIKLSKATDLQYSEVNVTEL